MQPSLYLRCAKRVHVLRRRPPITRRQAVHLGLWRHSGWGRGRAIAAPLADVGQHGLAAPPHDQARTCKYRKFMIKWNYYKIDIPDIHVSVYIVIDCTSIVLHYKSAALCLRKFMSHNWKLSGSENRNILIGISFPCVGHEPVYKLYIAVNTSSDNFKYNITYVLQK